jgi:hypothetical protein
MNGELVVWPVVGEPLHPDPDRGCHGGNPRHERRSTDRAQRGVAWGHTGARRDGFVRWRRLRVRRPEEGVRRRRGEVGDEVKNKVSRYSFDAYREKRCTLYNLVHIGMWV